jgi:hypothetical protein
MKISGNRMPVAGLVLAVFFWTASTPAIAVTLNVAFDTSALAGQMAMLAFDFIDGDAAAAGVANNTATISGFSPVAALEAGATSTGGVSGTLNPGPLTLTDTQFFNEFLQPVVLGGLFGFTVAVTENFAKTIPPTTVPDEFSLALLDAAGIPFPTSDPTGANLLAVAGADGTAALFALQVQAIPEPSTPTLLVAALVGLLGIRARRYRGDRTTARSYQSAVRRRATSLSRICGQ